MAKGKNTSQKDICKIMTAWAVNPYNLNEVSRVTGMPYSTVYQVVNKYKTDEKYDKLRDQKRADFADKASEIIDKGLELINRRISTALDKQDELDTIISNIEQTSDEEMSYQAKMSAIATIKETQIQKIKDISTTVGTLYDKRALAKGETTQNINFVASPETVDKIAKLAGYEKNEQ